MSVEKHPDSINDNEKYPKKEYFIGSLASIKNQLISILNNKLSLNNPEELTQLCQQIVDFEQSFTQVRNKFREEGREAVSLTDYEAMRNIFHNTDAFLMIKQTASAYLSAISRGKVIPEGSLMQFEKALQSNLLNISGSIIRLEALVIGKEVKREPDHLKRIITFLEGLPENESEVGLGNIPIEWKIIGEVENEMLVEDAMVSIDFFWINEFIGNVKQNARRIASQRRETTALEPIELTLRYRVEENYLIVAVEDTLGGYEQAVVNIERNLLDDVDVEVVHIEREASTMNGEGIGLDSLETSLKENEFWQTGTITRDGKRGASTSFKVLLSKSPLPQ